MKNPVREFGFNGEPLVIPGDVVRSPHYINLAYAFPAGKLQNSVSVQLTDVWLVIAIINTVRATDILSADLDSHSTEMAVVMSERYGLKMLFRSSCQRL